MKVLNNEDVNEIENLIKECRNILNQIDISISHLRLSKDYIIENQLFLEKLIK